MKVFAASLLVAASASASLHPRHHHLQALGRRDEDCPADAVKTTYLSTITLSPAASAVSAGSSSTTTVTVRETSTTTKHITVTPVHTDAAAPPLVSTSIPPVAPPPAVTSATSATPVTSVPPVPPVAPVTLVEPPHPSTIETSTAPSATAAVINIPAVSDNESDVRATSYTEDGIGQGHCSFTGYTLPAGIFGTALSVQSWDGASRCGSCVEVTNPSTGAKVKAMIVDSCPGCPSGGLDLFESTFSQIASTAAGYLSVDWQLVDCGLNTPVQVVFKDGSGADWFSLQLRNHNKPIGKVEVSVAGTGDWQALSRTEDNYFPKAGGVGGWWWYGGHSCDGYNGQEHHV
ncbi:Expansin-like protein 1 [Talaromyces islandicus]|uniref:Expansin-like protein 1 n=1 Tax=Talaromyces islandicus TaxID=28573 RepID=A0A0U1LX33_TALIS|nr:Expansin-like protein 1 [Talaromyces islandicus]